MKTPITKTIDSKTYRFEPHLTTKGFLLLKNLTAVMGETIIRFIASVPKGTDLTKPGAILESDLDHEKMAAAFGTMFAKLDDAMATKLMQDILERTYFGNTLLSEIFETHFQEHGYKHLMRVMWEAVQAEYGDFLGAITGGVLKQKLTVREAKTGT